MNESKISVRYAKALFTIAEENKITDTIRKDMELFLECIDTMEDFKNFIANPVLKPSRKQQILHEIFKGKVHPISLSFFDLVIKNIREEHLPAMARYFIQLYKTRLGIKSATIITSKPLSNELKELVIKIITKKFKTKLELKDVTDESLIGGFILRIDDLQIDASIASSLNKIKKELLNA